MKRKKRQRTEGPLVERDKVKLACRNCFRTMVKRVIHDPDEQRARLRFLLNHPIKLVNGFSFATTSSQGAAAHVELSLLLVLEMKDWGCTVKHKASSEEKR